MTKLLKLVGIFVCSFVASMVFAAAFVAIVRIIAHEVVRWMQS